MIEESVKCPHCGAVMEHVVEPDMTFEKCPKCDGLFLDQGELNALATGMSGDIEYCSIQNLTIDSDRFPVRSCPKCPGQKMKKESLLIYSELIFDLCEKCHGWFLDRGELKKMNAILSDLRKAQGGEAEYRGTHRDRLVTVNEFTTTEVTEHSAVLVRWMRVDVYYNKPLDAGLRISPETWAAKLWKLFGTQDVKTGDEEFDRTFLVNADSEVQVKKRLTASARQALLSFYRSPLAKVAKKRTFEVLDDKIVFCYSAWGHEKYKPEESEKQKLMEALVDVAVAIDESCR